MNTYIKILLLVFVATLWGCEKNDPLADQGNLTGNIVPFNLLAQMPDAAAGDTIVLRNVSWAVEDNIENITFHHGGFKVRTYELKWAVTAANGTVYERTHIYVEDTVHISRSAFATYPEAGTDLNQYYQTQENAYVILHQFIVPQQYTLAKDRDTLLINSMADATFNVFVETFTPTLNRNMLVAIFPEINRFSVTYFTFDSGGNFTGELTDAGFDYFRNNITRNRFNEFVKEATVADNTRVRIETEAIATGSSKGALSGRIFRVL